jgi:hypothetical protein
VLDPQNNAITEKEEEKSMKEYPWAWECTPIFPAMWEE